MNTSTCTSWLRLAMGLLLAAILPPLVSIQAETPQASKPGDALVVGRVYHIEGQLLRYVPETKDWVAMVRDTPFEKGDTLFSGAATKAELIIPNGVWARIGDNTQVQFIAQESNFSQIDVASGMARFQVKTPGAMLKATSAFGYVLANEGDVFDFYVGDNSAEVVPVKGKVSFVHGANAEVYDVAAGGPSLLADAARVTNGDGGVDGDWDKWNRDRDAVWAEREAEKYRSTEYLPPAIQEDAQVFDSNGVWERVEYNGAPCTVWTPTTVAVGWSPFTVGRWVTYYGDQVWIPAEPFGYVTHHYGNWVFVHNRWRWAPPVLSIQAGFPSLNIGFFWNPGRVSWIYSDGYVGWVPLDYTEEYYCHRYYGGPNITVVNIGFNIDIDAHRHHHHHHLDRAVVIRSRDLYAGHEYSRSLQTHVGRDTLFNHYKSAPVLNNTAVKDFSGNANRFNFTNAEITRKPYSGALKRIDTNNRLIETVKPDSVQNVLRNAKALPAGKISTQAPVETPRIGGKLVPAGTQARPGVDLQPMETPRPLKTKVVKPETHPATLPLPKAAHSGGFDAPTPSAPVSPAPAKVTPPLESPKHPAGEGIPQPGKIVSPREERRRSQTTPGAAERMQTPAPPKPMPREETSPKATPATRPDSTRVESPRPGRISYPGEERTPQTTTSPRMETPKPSTAPRYEAPAPTPRYEERRPQATPAPRYEAPAPTPRYEERRPQATPAPRYEAPQTPRYEAPQPAPRYESPSVPPTRYEAPSRSSGQDSSVSRSASGNSAKEMQPPASSKGESGGERSRMGGAGRSSGEGSPGDERRPGR